MGREGKSYNSWLSDTFCGILLKGMWMPCLWQVQHHGHLVTNGNTLQSWMLTSRNTWYTDQRPGCKLMFALLRTPYPTSNICLTEKHLFSSKPSSGVAFSEKSFPILYSLTQWIIPSFYYFYNLHIYSLPPIAQYIINICFLTGLRSRGKQIILKQGCKM